uniref:Calcyclin-binding protein n=2 Tax=Parascaris univalens TaxID=6257 RepID=A0A914ZRR3_PARUN
FYISVYYFLPPNSFPQLHQITVALKRYFTSKTAQKEAEGAVMESVAELRRDLHELQNLRSMASRQSVRKWLDEKAMECEHRMNELKEQKLAVPSGDTDAAMVHETVMPSTVSAAPLPTVKITNYAWDQSDKFVKIYITMPGVQSVASEQVSIEFTEGSFEMNASNVSSNNYSLIMKGLLNAIDPTKSYFKQKTDSLLILLKKSKEGEHWKYLTKAEMSSKEKSTPKFDEKADPQESLMNMMKQLYDEGDDEMKRTIRKAWHESQTKKGAIFDEDM